MAKIDIIFEKKEVCEKNIKKKVVALKTFVFLQRRYGRAVDRGGLENRYTEMYRGFESLCLR